MTNFPMHAPPETSGVYALKHKTTGQIYVGQSVNLRRRYFEWRTVFSSKLGATNQSLHGALQNSKPEEWEFSILAEVTPEKLNETENETIRRLRAAAPGLCLNGTPDRPEGFFSAVEEGSLALSVVTDEQGQQMTYGQVAKRCGVTKQAVKKRLAAWRGKGKNKFTIQELM